MRGMDDRDTRQAGFTMVEVIAAIVILTVGVLGLAGTTAYVVRQVTLSNVVTQRAVALQSVIEKVQAMPFSSVGSGSDSVGNYVVRWTSSTETVASKLVTVITTGPGLHATTSNPFPILGTNVADTFVYRVISR
jgi:prepilin-type N-terminal cleavage/methylation domain-containing protein